MAANAEIHTLATPYALHALSDEDVELFEQHLAECAACQAEVDEIRETATRLGTAAAVVPPSELKADVMRRVAHVRPLPPTEDVDDGDRRALEAGVRRRGWRRWWGPAATGLAAAMTAGVIMLGVQLNETRDDLERAEQLATQVEELVAAPDAEMIHADGDAAAGTVVMARSLNTAVVLARDMDPVSAEETYQMWFIGDDGARSAGVLGDTDDGQLGPVTAHGLDDAEHIGITVEPAGGSEQPTTDPVMVIDLPTAPSSPSSSR
ncbi:anti-sigma factor [Phytoactinopolyspora halophila]|nr:anti-sigma factor [Phytoactinopolyspora halophila]